MVTLAPPVRSTDCLPNQGNRPPIIHFSQRSHIMLPDASVHRVIMRSRATFQLTIRFSDPDNRFLGTGTFNLAN